MTKDPFAYHTKDTGRGSMSIWFFWLLFSVMLFIGALWRVGVFLSCFTAGALAGLTAALWGAELDWQLRLFLLVTILGIGVIKHRRINPI